MIDIETLHARNKKLEEALQIIAGYDKDTINSTVQVLCNAIMIARNAIRNKDGSWKETKPNDYTDDELLEFSR